MKSACSAQWAVGSEAAGGWTLAAGRVVAVLAVVTLCASSALAQDRLPPIPPDKLTDAQKKAAAEFLVERKQEVFGPFVPLSRSPQLMINAAQMGTYLRFGNSLPRDVSEFAILPSAACTYHSYCCVHRREMSRTAGLSDAII